MTVRFSIPAVIHPIETEEEKAERQLTMEEMHADSERYFQEWMAAHPDAQLVSEPSPNDVSEPTVDPMYDFYRVKDNFRELNRIIDAEDIAACVITRRRVFWFMDVPANDLAYEGYDWIMSTRYFWPDFDEGTPISKRDAFRLIAESTSRPEEDDMMEAQIKIAA
jgi:hypothetical protein